MDECFQIENFLYSESFEKEFKPDNISFFIEKVIQLPSLRPFLLEKACRLCIDYCMGIEFRQLFLTKSTQSCPVIVYRLFRSGILVFDEIIPYLENKNSYILSFYFRDQIQDFSRFVLNKFKPGCYDESYFSNESDINGMINYGFIPSSIEYCLKYDDIEALLSKNCNKHDSLKWSPFEWSQKPKALDFLSVSGYFGSIRCFKHLMMNGFVINDVVISHIVCNGNGDLFHLCTGESCFSNLICGPAEFNQIPLLEYMIERGYDLNYEDNQGYIPLQYAAMKHHITVIDLLLKHGANVNSINKRNESPLHYAAKYCSFHVVQSFINHGAKINVQDYCFKEYTIIKILYIGPQKWEILK